VNWKGATIQTLNIMREEIGKILTSWSFFILALFTIGFFMFSVLGKYPQMFSTDYGVIKAMIGANALSEAVEFISRYSVLQLTEILGSQLLFLFSITLLGFNVGVFIVMLVALQTCDNIASDRLQGTLLLYFSKPIRRSKLVLARFASFAVTSFILIFAIHVIPLLLISLYVLIPNGVFLECFSNLFVLILGGALVLTSFLLAVGAITYLFSSLTKNSLLACLGALMVTIIPSYITAYALGSEWTRIDLEGSLYSLYTSVINYDVSSRIFPSRLVPTTWFNFPQPEIAALILLFFIIAPLLLACIATEFREFQ